MTMLPENFTFQELEDSVTALHNDEPVLSSANTTTKENLFWLASANYDIEFAPRWRDSLTANGLEYIRTGIWTSLARYTHGPHATTSQFAYNVISTDQNRFLTTVVSDLQIQVIKTRKPAETPLPSSLRMLTTRARGG